MSCQLKPDVLISEQECTKGMSASGLKRLLMDCFQMAIDGAVPPEWEGMVALADMNKEQVYKLASQTAVGLLLPCS